MNANIETLRKQIDILDYQIVKLLDERMQICYKVGEIKKTNNIVLTHPTREKNILNRLSNSKDLSILSKEDIINLYKLIFMISKSKQN